MALAAPSIGPPSRALLLLEPGRALSELFAGYLTQPLLRAAPSGDGHPVLVVPGLGASGLSTRPLRRFLRGRNYSAHDWKLGRNRGDPGYLERLAQRLADIRLRHGGRTVSLIGWSLGGIYARELAKAEPTAVRSVITLGTPFTGPPLATNAAGVYRSLSGRPAGDATLHARFRSPPPVPTTSIYSRSDGVVAWQCSVERPGPKAENIELVSSHLGLGVHPLALYAIADRLAQAEGGWKKFAVPTTLRACYRTS